MVVPRIRSVRILYFELILSTRHFAQQAASWGRGRGGGGSGPNWQPFQAAAFGDAGCDLRRRADQGRDARSQPAAPFMGSKVLRAILGPLGGGGLKKCLPEGRLGDTPVRFHLTRLGQAAKTGGSRCGWVGVSLEVDPLASNPALSG